MNASPSLAGIYHQGDKSLCTPNFTQEHKNMLSHLYSLVNKGYLCIPSKFDKLIISLRTAQANDLSLDKEATSYDDIFDSLRLALRCYRMK